MSKYRVCQIIAIGMPFVTIPLDLGVPVEMALLGVQIAALCGMVYLGLKGSTS